MAVLDIRGTHGSGKSWIVHQLLKGGKLVCRDDEGTFIGYRLKKNPQVSVVGKYVTQCGGCDGVGSADEVVRRVRYMSQRYACVILEGILVSHTFKRYSDLAHELGNYTFLFLDTPLEVCIHRVEERRRARGDTRPLDPKNVIKDHFCVFTKVRTKMKAEGHRVLVLRHTNPLTTVKKEIKKWST